MNEPTIWDAIKNPEWITAVLGGVALLIGTVWVNGKTKETKKPTTAAHQEVLRPETQSEQRSASALTEIAEVLEKIERHIDFYMRGNR